MPAMPTEVEPARSIPSSSFGKEAGDRVTVRLAERLS
jgi:hypothetical protein